MEMHIRDKCHIKSNKEDNGFVGIKYENGDISINFPIGFHVSDDEIEIRQDIFLLIKTISNTVSNRDSILPSRQTEYDQVDFPMQSYLEIIYDFMERGYYRERETIYDEKKNGKINWSRTIKRKKPYIQKQSVYYLDFITKRNRIKESELITIIHKYIVYECFEKVGWLFTLGMPENPHIQAQIQLFINIINNKLIIVNNDKDKALFLNMIAVLKHISARKNNNVYYGTYRFEYVWEKLVDRVFGILQKEKYFPSTKWIIGDHTYDNASLEPDSIMVFEGNVYVLDAKYYKYGITLNPWDLPGTSSISKQIVYGEYIYENKKFKKEYGDNFLVYNAFIMPFDSASDKHSFSVSMINAAVAVSEWKHNEQHYEWIQGILVDTKFLMKAESKIHENIRGLASCIATGSDF